MDDCNVIFVKLGYIVSFSLLKTFNRDGSVSQFDLSINLSPSCSNDGDIVTLKFYDVKDLRVNDSINGQYYCCFTVYDIKNWQWEGCNYRVTEEEESCISLYCKKIQIYNG
jgi:hypothetical protein